MEERNVCSGGGFAKTSLMLAARDNTPEVAIRALECSLTQLDACDERGWTALMTAAERGHDVVVEVLADAGADVINPHP